MSLSVSIKRWQAARQKPVPGRGIRPEVLLDQGILGDPNDPQDACRRARGLVQQARYHDARDLLTPHLATPGALGRHILELVAQCAMYAGSLDWPELIGRCLHAYRQVKDTAGIARAHRNMGEMMLWVGRLDDADRHLRDAAGQFWRIDDRMRAAVVDCLRALVRLRAGKIDSAYRRIDDAVNRLMLLPQPRAEALARLDRARILACRGESSRAARDILLAERALGVSGSAEDRLIVRLTHAETLLTSGESSRAASGLSRLFNDADGLEDVATCAWMHLMLGQALTDDDPVTARRHLMRARHLYDNIKHTYPVTSCDIALVRVEHRLQLDPRSRLQALSARSFSEWPLLAVRLELARAEIKAFDSPEAARAALYRARSFANDNGHRALVRQLDLVLVKSGLAAANEVNELTPVDTVTGSNTAHLEASTALRPGASPQSPQRKPQPMVLTPEDDAQLTERPHKSDTERLLRVPAGNRAPLGPRPARSAMRPK